MWFHTCWITFQIPVLSLGAVQISGCRHQIWWIYCSSDDLYDIFSQWLYWNVLKLNFIPFWSLFLSQERRVGGGLWRAEGDLQRGAGGRGPGHPPKQGVLLHQRWTALRQTAAEGEDSDQRLPLTNLFLVLCADKTWIGRIQHAGRWSGRE